MAFPILLLAGIAIFWLAGETQQFSEPVITWLVYALSFYLVLFGFLKAVVQGSSDD